jgi:acyl-CoA dehydrogenase
MTWMLLFALIAGLYFCFGIEANRLKWVSTPALAWFKKALPPLSTTEQQAIDAGDVWWDGDLFQGQPDWQKLHALPKNSLSEREQAFIDHQVVHLLKMLDEYTMTQDLKDLPEPVWAYLKKEGFFALIIPQTYGGLEFSAYAVSTLVSMIASRSLSTAVTVMVPNSLGPGELLSHYGTEAQKQRWLPALAKGKEIPCFALTSPEAGSDAGGMPDFGVVAWGKHQGEKVLGIRLTWEKRYITLAPIATVLGLAFRLKDPDNLLERNQTELGITCALVPTSHKGVEIGRRHNPLNVPFMNGNTSGKDVFIPMDWVIGGSDYVGKGWGMLMECLSSGRGISLPALASAKGHLATRTTTAYASVRQQFGVSIVDFEGIQAPLARIVANTYQLEAARRLTATAVDMKLKPAIVSAISKYHMTEMSRQLINDAMDIHAGKAIQLGRKNYLAQAYMGLPITVTVEGSNILTRSLMIFGQGAFRCHPFVLAEIQAAAQADPQQALQDFDQLLKAHLVYGVRNAGRSLVSALTSSRLNRSFGGHQTGRYYQHLTRFSSVLALLTDLSLITFQGQLKRKEMFSARLGDVLSHLYLASSVLKMYEDDGAKAEQLPLVNYVIQTRLYDIAEAIRGALQNFPNPVLRGLCYALIFPLGQRFQKPKDELAQAVVAAVAKPNALREQLTYLCPIFEDEPYGLAEVERAFLEKQSVLPLEKKLVQACRSGQFNAKLPIPERIAAAIEHQFLTSEEGHSLSEAFKLYRIAIDVDDFETL